MDRGLGTLRPVFRHLRPFSRAACSAALAAGLLSCGGGSSQAPTPVVATPTPRPSGWAAGTTLTIVSGETDAPVTGARVTIAGIAQAATDAAGQTTLAGPATEGATVDVEATGFLTRQTLVRYATTRLSLWPEGEQLPESYTKKLVYTSAGDGDSTAPVPLERLPPRVRTVSLEPSDELKSDQRAMIAHQGGADLINAALEAGPTFVVGGTADLRVPTRIDATHKSCDDAGTLLALIWVTAQEVSRAEIVFCGPDPSRMPMPIAHELGHVLGLGHSPASYEVMYPYYLPNREHPFMPREVLTMRLISQRRGGNTWPDNDRTAATSARRQRVFVN